MNWHLPFLIFLFLSSSCSIFKRQGSWGKNALWPIKKERIIEAFKKNISSPHVWLPLGLASTLRIGKFDENLSSWASKEKPVYHNQKRTSYFSDGFNDVLLYEMYLSSLLTPSLDETESLSKYALSKSKGILVVTAASRSTRYARKQIAQTARRERPNHENNQSFPSGHATEASSRNRLISKNLDSITMNSSLRTGINTLNTTMAAGTMWARIEGKRHYGSDVLAGYALGSFLSGFIYDSLMNIENGTLSIVPLKDEVSINYGMQF
jgi:hypothetical protein